MTRQDHEVIDFTRSHVKNKANLPILGINNKLKGIMVNKGRIHRELRYFRDIFWKLIKLDDELR